MSNIKVEATSTFFLLDSDGDKINKEAMEKYLFNPRCAWGYSKFVKQSAIYNPKNKADGKIIIVCKIIVHNISNKDQNSFSRLHLLIDFEKLFLEKKFTDLTVISSDKKNLYVHKAILASRSPVFSAMLEHNMEEKMKNIVNIEDIKYEVLFQLFRFIYSGNANIESMLLEILPAADKYAVEGLKQLCERTMIENLTIETAIKYLIEAKKNNCNIVQVIVDYIVINSKILVESEEFISLGISNPDLTQKIMKALVDTTDSD